MTEPENESSGVTFPLPDRRLTKALWYGFVAALSVWTVGQLLTGGDPFAAWPAFLKAVAALCSTAAVWGCGSRAHAAWREYQRRNNLPRIEQLDNPQ